MAKQASKHKKFRPSDLLEQVMITGLAISPDGESVVYARRTIEDGRYRKRLWRIDYEGGAEEQLTSSQAADDSPRFSPDGKSLLFLSDRSGQVQPWVMGMSGGEPRLATAGVKDVKAAEWSPDGRRIALLAPSGEERFLVGRREDPVARRITDLTWRLDEVGYRDQFTSLWTATVEGKSKRVVAPDFEVEGLFWGPDGRRVGFLADMGPGASALELPHAWAVGRSGGDVEELASLPGALYRASWSPHGELVAIGRERPNAPEWCTPRLYVLRHGELEQLGDPGLTLEVTSYGDLIDPDALWSLEWVDEDNVVALVSREGRTVPCRFSLSGEVEPLATGEIVTTSMAAGGGRIVAVASDRGRPGEVSAVEDGSLRPLTKSGGSWIEPWRRDPEHHRVAHSEGHRLDTWLVPARGKRQQRPLVVQVHGGPHASYGPTPWLEMLALADAGMHVIYCNPRGSTSYSEDFARALHGAWGEPDSSDILAAIDWAVAEGLTRPDRVGVLGLSYGGFMVNWLLGHYPERFAAGVSENPVTDLVSEYGGSDYGALLEESSVGAGTLPEDLERFLAQSPYLSIHKTMAPLLLLQAEADLRCPPLQSELVFNILRMRGAPVEMVRYPQEAHYMVGTGRPDRRVDRMRRVVDWFERHLK